MLTTLIETGFQNKLKTSAAFVDLSLAYDTVWRHGLINKFSIAVPSKNLVTLLENMLTNRHYQVFMGRKGSKWCRANNAFLKVQF